MKEPINGFIQDPLRECTRKERRALLGIAFTAIAVVVLDLKPLGISSLGITFDALQFEWLSWMWVSIVVYFMVAFLVYAASDLVAWQYEIAEYEWVKEKREYENVKNQLEKNRQDGQKSSGLIMSQDEYDLYEADNKRYEPVFLAQEKRLSFNKPIRAISTIRMVFDFGFPVVMGLLAIVLIISN